MTEEIMLVDDLVFPELESGFVCIEEHCVGDVIEHVCIFIYFSYNSAHVFAYDETHTTERMPLCQ
jgi:hypothetical protein